MTDNRLDALAASLARTGRRRSTVRVLGRWLRNAPLRPEADSQESLASPLSTSAEPDLARRRLLVRAAAAAGAAVWIPPVIESITLPAAAQTGSPPPVVGPEADLRVTQATSTSSSSTVITVTIENLGPDPVVDTGVTGTVTFDPSQIYFFTADPNGGTAPPVGTCPDPGPGATASGFSWSCSGLALPSGTTVIYTITITDLDPSTLVRSQAQASDAVMPDPVSTNNAVDDTFSTPPP